MGQLAALDHAPPDLFLLSDNDKFVKETCGNLHYLRLKWSYKTIKVKNKEVK